MKSQLSLVFKGFQPRRTSRPWGGGSDTTAVALAAALDADVCEIYTDVSGVFTADPRAVPSARRLARVSFDEMLEMAATGGRVLALRSVEFARNHNVPLHVRSSFTWEPGTWVDDKENPMEQAIISGVTHDSSEAKLTVTQVPDEPGVAAKIFRALADKNVNVDMIVQNVGTDGAADISFTVPKADLAASEAVLGEQVAAFGAGGFAADADIGRVSLIGAGMKSNPGIAARMFETLANEGINIEMISTSTIRTSCVVHADDLERAVVALHGAFELGGVVGDMAQGIRVGVIGATGLVGTQMLRLLEERSFPVSELVPFASERSRGRELPFAGGVVACRVLEDGCFDGLDLVIVDVDDPIALEWAPQAAAAGAKVVDNSAAFRMDPDVPLVVAEVNPEDLTELPHGIAACPNCTTMVLLTAIAPLHRAAGINRMVISTYQSVSGAGQPGMRELESQWRALANDLPSLATAGQHPEMLSPGEVWDRPIAGNVIPLAGSRKESGYTSEEWKLVYESRKILHAGTPCDCNLCACPGSGWSRHDRQHSIRRFDDRRGCS